METKMNKGKIQEQKREHINIWKYKIFRQERLIPLLQTLSSQLENGNEINYRSLWYRGETTGEDRKIMPSIFRDLKDDNFKQRYQTMRSFSEQAVEEFSFRSNLFKETVQYTLTEYVTLLQHYELHTHFLDWSEDAFTALYFAFEKYLNSERAAGDPEYQKKDVKITLFDPRKYNRIRSWLLQTYLKTEDKTNDIKGTNGRSQFKYQCMLNDRIPNLSIRENQKMFQEFLPFLHEKMQCFCKKGSPEMMRYLPVAIWASKANERLSAQNGTFLAFNLDTPAHICEQVSLDAIQKKVLELWEKNTSVFHDKVPVFMYIITIDRRICRDIANWLRSMGMSTERLYPELKNIGKRITHADLPLDRISENRRQEKINL